MNELLDAYIDGTLPPAERAAVEARLLIDPELQRALDEARQLRAQLASLRQPVQPERDLWPQIEAETQAANRRWIVPTALLGGGVLVAAGVAAALLLGVAGIAATTSDILPFQIDLTSTEPAVALRWDRPPTDGPVAIGHALLREGDLPGADVAFAAAVDAHPERADALIAYAYTRMLQGDHDQADALLGRAEAGLPPDRRADVKLRRALVAFERRDLSNVQRYAAESGLPAGLVLAAEVHLADAEATQAIPLLQRASRSDEPRVAETAETYLAFLRGESARAQLAEATAMWALGLRTEAVESSQDLLVYLPVEETDRDELLLLWAGRAAAARRDDIAEALLDEMGGAPEGQAWRMHATRGIVLASRDESEEAARIFDALDMAGAPIDGVRDARLTAALVSDDEDASRILLAGLDGAGAALLSGEARRLDRVDTPLDRYLRRE